MLAMYALAPVLGAESTLSFTLSAPILLLYLAFFAGFVLYIVAAENQVVRYFRGGRYGSTKAVSIA
jgi:zinc transporter ZupT